MNQYDNFQPPDYENMTLEQVILNLIASNDIENLREIGVQARDLNFLEPFNEIDLDNRITPLICAVYYGRNEIVRLLLENRAIDIDQNTQSGYGHTALTVAASRGNYEILKTLIEAGAEVNKPTFFSHTPFVCCFQRLEEEQNVFENKLITFKMAELLLQSGADINWIVDKKRGHTLLMQLCANKVELSRREISVNYDILKFLVENGANKQIITLKGKNAYDLAEKHCNRDNVRALLTLHAPVQRHLRPLAKPLREIESGGGGGSGKKSAQAPP